MKLSPPPSNKAEKLFESATLKSLRDLGFSMEVNVWPVGSSGSWDTWVTLRAPNDEGSVTASLVNRDFQLGLSAPTRPTTDQLKIRRYSGKGWRDRLVFDARTALTEVWHPKEETT